MGDVDDAVGNRRKRSQDVPDFYEWGISESNKRMINYAFVSKSACKESKKQIDDAMTMINTPAKGTMSLHAVIPISSGRIAVRVTLCL